MAYDRRTLWPALVVVLVALAFVAPHADAKNNRSRGAGHAAGAAHLSASKHASTSARAPRAASGVKRDSHGRIARSAHARQDFRKTHPCPATGKTSGACKGYVIDHVKPLKRGGADAPSNMQWQTSQAAKRKDKAE